MNVIIVHQINLFYLNYVLNFITFFDVIKIGFAVNIISFRIIVSLYYFLYGFSLFSLLLYFDNLYPTMENHSHPPNSKIISNSIVKRSKQKILLPITLRQK